VDQEQQPRKQIAGDRLLSWIGLDPAKWTEGDRRLALSAIGIVLGIVIITVCGYVFGWEWPGLVKPKQRTSWDWLSLLIVPIVLALGGYFFTRTESRRAKEDAEQQREADRHLADQRAQDDALQAYLDHIGELLLDNDKPLRNSEEGDEVRTLARARTSTVLRRLDGERKGRVLQFLRESRLIAKDRPVLVLGEANLSGAHLNYAYLDETHLSEVNLSGARLNGTSLSGADLRRANLSGASMNFADLTNTDLSGAYLQNTDLTSADLIKADLRYVNFHSLHTTAAKPIGANPGEPTGTNLSGASLGEADLSGAILTGADLTGADCDEANLAGVNFSGAILDLASFDRGTGILEEELAQHALSLKRAVMPNGQRYEEWLKTKERTGGEDGENTGPS
jgi:uncharacterized protein YjbI with pentapeptide repeats